MAITRFPQETDQPIFDVTLPPGRHVLELVVEDSAGLRSEPDTVVITVENILPEITGINPNAARQGTENVAAVITGTNLVNVDGVSFAGDGITVVEFTESSPEQLQVELSVAADAALGSRRFTVTTDAGSVQSPGAVVFTVEQGLPEISAIAPASGRQGAADLILTISGNYLVGVTQVTFAGGGIAVSDISEVSPQALDITVAIEPDTAVGDRGFTVTTAAGAADSPSGVRFTVLQAAPEITAIEPDSGAPGVPNLNVVIRGSNLVEVQSVRFEGDDINVRDFSERSPTELSIFLDIDAQAASGPRSFLVETSGGAAESPSGVSFTVLRAVPEISAIEPESGAQGARNFPVVIRGANLVGVRRVVFEGDGIEVTGFSESEQTDTELFVVINIAVSAPVGARSFLVETRGGEAASPARVVFSVTLAEEPTIRPTIGPTIRPTLVPTLSPTLVPTLRPTLVPTISPTLAPTLRPTFEPTFSPTLAPTLRPTLVPTFSPTFAPTFVPGPIGPIIFSAREFPGRSVQEVNGIGPATAERLKQKRITNLAHLASMEPAKLAEILEISEVRAMAFIDEARRLLTEEQ
jgi:hypothetical protein